MAKRISEVEFDEFEKLLCEIPGVTSANSNSEEPEVQQHIERVQMNGSLSSDKALASAFEDLSLKDGSPMGAIASSLAKSSTFPNPPVSLNGLSPNSVVPSPRSPVNPPTGFDANSQELMKQQVGYCQMVEGFSGALPLPHGPQGYHMLSNVAIPAVEFPVITNQQPLFYDGQSPLPYLNAQQLSQPHVTWSIDEEQQLLWMQYLYFQQLRNQQLECPIQENGNLATALISQNKRHPCKPDHYWNKPTIRRNINQSNHILSFADLNTMQTLRQEDKQNFPEKILTRSHSLNPLRGGNQVRRVLPNYFNSNLTNPNVEFQFESFGSRGFSPDTAHLRHNYLRQPVPKYSSIDDILADIIYSMAKDQHGCRFLQRKFTEGTQEDVESIFRGIIVHIVELMTDPFGNYLVQKLLEVCNEEQLMQTLRAITRKAGDLVRISCDMHGTRAVQKVIESLKTPEQFSFIVSALKPGIVSLMKNMNGNHVAQRCLQCLTPEYNEFLFEAATIHCVELATDRHGCCVLQKCLSHSDGEQRRCLVYEITSAALFLSQDPYGNYVVQYIFEIRVPWAITNIIGQLEGNYVDLSMQKYSSNVVEKCLKYAGEDRRLRIIKELMSYPRLDQIMQDPYGNYVIQAALNLSKGALHDALVEAIRPHVPVLRTSPYGKKVLSSNGLKI